MAHLICQGKIIRHFSKTLGLLTVIGGGAV